VTELGTGALVWAGFDGEQVPGPILDAIRAGKIGGLLLFAFRGNIRSKDQVRAMVREAQEAAVRGDLPPVPIAVDQEGGTVVRVGYRAVFPSAMAIGATGDPRNAERAARAVGEGLLADGITVNHAPVCDVNVEPRNPVIGTRSFGDDAERVAQFTAAWVRGSEGAGVASTPKHFPGHGDTSLDSHFTRPDVTVDRATLERRELLPFRSAFAAGATTTMSAHIRYTALDSEAPATISRPILTDLLRRELRFDGLSMTDSLDMSGIADISIEDVVVTGLEAGVDAMMVTSGLERQLAAAQWIADRVRPERTREALRRATWFRERFGRTALDADFDDEPRRDLALQIAEASITQVGRGALDTGVDARGRAPPPSRRQRHVLEQRPPASRLGTAGRLLDERLVPAGAGVAREGSARGRRSVVRRPQPVRRGARTERPCAPHIRRRACVARGSRRGARR